jgi:hypothetical protein
VLAVVHEEQELPCAHVRELRRAERVRDSPLDEAGLGERGQVDEPDTVRPRVELPACDLQREPGLAGAADPGERDEAVLPERCGELVELPLAAEEARRRGRQVVPGVARLDERDLVAEDRPHEPPQLLARLQAQHLAERPAS